MSPERDLTLWELPCRSMAWLRSAMRWVKIYMWPGGAAALVV